MLKKCRGKFECRSHLPAVRDAFNKEKNRLLTLKKTPFQRNCFIKFWTFFCFILSVSSILLFSSITCFYLATLYLEMFFKISCYEKTKSDRKFTVWLFNFYCQIEVGFFFLSPILETQLSHRAQVAIAALSGGWFDDKFKNVHNRVQSLILIMGSIVSNSSLVDRKARNILPHNQVDK